MTQDDYDQKKRECWEEFQVANRTTLETTKQAFDYIFDRAYALGKQEKDADTVISGWVFVDDITFDRYLRVHKVTQGDYEAVWDSGEPEFCLGEELFPDTTPNSDPEPVEIIIKRKKK